MATDPKALSVEALRACLAAVGPKGEHATDAPPRQDGRAPEASPLPALLDAVPERTRHEAHDHSMPDAGCFAGHAQHVVAVARSQKVVGLVVTGVDAGESGGLVVTIENVWR